MTPQQLRSLRYSANASLYEFACVLNVRIRTLRRWEAGSKPIPDDLEERLPKTWRRTNHMTKWAKISEVKAGSVLKIDSGFTCIGEETVTVHHADDGFFFLCNEGRHYLDGQYHMEENGTEVYIGLILIKC